MVKSAYESNKALGDRIIAFDALKSVMCADGAPVGRGPADNATPVKMVETLPDGSVAIRMAAKGAQKVEVSIGNLGYRAPVMELTPREDGIFEYIRPYEKRFHGLMILSFAVDGVQVVNPYLPVFYNTAVSRYINYFDFPDETMPYLEVRNVPHGAVTRELFHSEAAGEVVSCVVYTPPTYSDGRDYPVLYLQHGAGENEMSWVHDGRVQHIMDNLIADGEAEPFIIVMNNGKLNRAGMGDESNFSCVEEVITKESREYIESRYRVKKDKWSRAIGGLSLGSQQASVIGFTHPELYGWVGCFTKIGAGAKKPFEENEHLKCFDDKERFGKDYKLLFRSVGEFEYTDEFFAETEALEKRGITELPCHHATVYPNVAHEWNNWRMALADYARLLFR